MINISKEQIKKAFVSEVENIGEYVYNNQDWYQEDSQRIRYILATLELSPGDSYTDKVLTRAIYNVNKDKER